MVEVTDRLERRRCDGLERQLGGEIEHPMAHRLVDRACDAHQHAAAHEVEQALEGEHHQRQDADGHQGRHAAAGQHAVVDLQHEQRAGELQDVDGGREQRDADEGMAIAGECRSQLRGRRGGSCWRHFSDLSYVLDYTTVALLTLPQAKPAGARGRRPTLPEPACIRCGLLVGAQYGEGDVQAH